MSHYYFYLTTEGTEGSEVLSYLPEVMVDEASDRRDFRLQTRVFASVLWTLPWMVILLCWGSGKGICLVLYTLQAYLLI